MTDQPNSESPREVDLLVTGIGELATPEGEQPLSGSGMGRLSVQRGVAVACDAGRFVAIGPEAELIEGFRGRDTLDAGGGLAIPGLVDSHTHPVFLGTREGEFEQRVAGRSYVEIAAAGGGIRSSLEGVRASTELLLLEVLLPRLDRFLQLGTTTIEAKTGYGLTVADELKGLDVIAAANRSHAVELIPTCLGGHDVPPEFKGRPEAWIDVVCAELWPAAASKAAFADVFTESHVFGLEASRRLMESAREQGLGLRMHVDQLTSLGGAELAAELGAASADHLEHVSEHGIAALAERGVQPVLCPLVPLYLGEAQEAPARRMIEAGCAPALSTDFNPGSCYCMSLFEVMSWAALRYGMSAAEALTGTTLNAACSLGLGHELGSVEVGKRADLVLTDLPNHTHLTYELGRNPVRRVIKGGAAVH
ncbi:MAG: imidazolonepropionase [Planctomycetes bacterium]|nr:imidazolonepropionase [Planctomycetota bacterium]